MTHLLHLQHEFDVATYGSLGMTWEDDAGAGHTLSITSGVKRHIGSTADSLTHPSGGLAISNTASAVFATTLQDAIDAQTTTTPTVSYSEDTNRYTMSMSGSTFTVTFTSAAELRLRALLGFAGNLSGATSYTGTLAPYFTIEPAKQVLVGWTDVRAVSDSVNVRTTGSGDLVTVGPARVPFTARFELPYETDAKTLSEFVVSPSYCWQQFWNDAGRNGRLCYLVENDPPVGNDLHWAFRLRTPVFDDATHRREQANLRDRWRVVFDVLIRGRW